MLNKPELTACQKKERGRSGEPPCTKLMSLSLRLRTKCPSMLGRVRSSASYGLTETTGHVMAAVLPLRKDCLQIQPVITGKADLIFLAQLASRLAPKSHVMMKRSMKKRKLRPTCRRGAHFSKHGPARKATTAGSQRGRACEWFK